MNYDGLESEKNGLKIIYKGRAKETFLLQFLYYSTPTGDPS